jgi:hypothetical protein
MTDKQLYFAVGLPCLTVIASLVVSMFTLSGVLEDIREIRGHLCTIVENSARWMSKSPN